MTRLQLRIMTTTAGSLALGTHALAGPCHVEPPMFDAGSTAATAQGTTGSGDLRCIRGSLGMTAEGPGDFEDMYIIQISTPGVFCARTVLLGETQDCCFSGEPINATHGTNFNPQLFLFKADGRGLLANDDETTISQLARMGNTATDGSGAMVVTPGIYFLAVSAGPARDPVSNPGGQLIFNQVMLTEVSGPDGPGGLNPIVGWTGAGQTNVRYEIFLCGCEFAPAIPTVTEWGYIALLGLTATAGAGFILKRQRELCSASVAV